MREDVVLEQRAAAEDGRGGAREGCGDRPAPRGQRAERTGRERKSDAGDGELIAAEDDRPTDDDDDRARNRDRHA